MRLMKSIKYLIYFFSGIFFAGSLTANAASLESDFIGNGAFRITDGEYILLTDFPYKSGAYGYMEYDFDFPGTTGNVLSLITHRHADHFEPLLFLEQNWKIIGPHEVTLRLAQNRVLKFADEMSFGPIKITPRRTMHANTEHYSYLVRWHGRLLFFTGDTDDIESLRNLPTLDALYITPWFYRKAKSDNALPESKKIIIYHHKEDDIVPDCSRCIIPEQNQIIRLE